MPPNVSSAYVRFTHTSSQNAHANQPSLAQDRSPGPGGTAVRKEGGNTKLIRKSLLKVYARIRLFFEPLAREL
eukprot:259118-Amphidinium_carterae.1